MPYLPSVVYPSAPYLPNSIFCISNHKHKCSNCDNLHLFLAHLMLLKDERLLVSTFLSIPQIYWEFYPWFSTKALSLTHALWHCLFILGLASLKSFPASIATAVVFGLKKMVWKSVHTRHHPGNLCQPPPPFSQELVCTARLVDLLFTVSYNGRLVWQTFYQSK